jgi:hypothetical protein
MKSILLDPKNYLFVALMGSGGREMFVWFVNVVKSLFTLIRNLGSMLLEQNYLSGLGDLHE